VIVKRGICIKEGTTMLEGEYEFQHLTFQEYLAAYAILKKHHPDVSGHGKLSHCFCGNWENPAMKEVILLTSALADEYNYLRLLSVIHNVRINPPPVGTAPVQRIMTALSSSHNDEYAKQLKITKQEETSLYRKHTTIPKTLSVHEVMECLKKANTVAECKIADYNLTTFTSARDKGIIETYLFNGDQRQRNYAALYMKRKGLNDILKKAFEAGKIDRVQAFSR